ncbi:hypothetical protein GCM10023187_40590 [Nibrella viscosa]|uniref:histidine kinase n=2 Tax=Nibrella viscosa TaxID=1084524 RepID=A0ABP8KRS7_9BACT
MDFRVFEATPGISVIVLPNPPEYTHVAVSNDFIRISGLKREAVIGRGHFTFFPQSPLDPHFTGEQNLRASFAHIIAHKEPHRIPLQRYDVPNGDGTFSERYWQIHNAPILDEQGELMYIVHSAVDVSDQVKSEQRSQHTIQFLFDTSPIGIVAYEAMRDQTGAITDFRLRHYNRRANELSGISIQERETCTFRQIMHLLGTSHLFATFVDVVEQDLTIEKEQYVEQTSRWLAITGAKFLDGFQVTLTDITELKTSQQSLQKEILFSKGILNASLNGIYVLKAIRHTDGTVADFIFLQGNQKFTELTGHRIEDIIGKSLLTLFPHVSDSGFFQLLCQIIEGEEAHRQTMYFAKSFKRWYDYIAVRLGEDSVVVTFQEITTLKEFAMQIEHQKNLLDNILKHSPSGITVYAAIRNESRQVIDFQCIIANQAAEVFTQIPNEDRLAKTVLTITPEIKDSPIFRMAVATLETGEAFQTQYYHAPIQKWLELSVAKMDNEHLINVFTDITGRKEVQLRLEASNKELRRSNDELKQFAYVASHDLQEPLRKIRMFSNMISANLEPDHSLRSYLDKIDNSTVRMTGLIKSLLDYSRLSGTSFSTRFERVDLNVILQNVLADYEVTISQKHATVYSEALPTLEAIPIQMNQLFFNLIGNALKFVRKDVSPVITVKVQNVSDERKASFDQLQKDRSYVAISVQDNGIGFNQEYASKIFTIFQRLNDRSLFDGYGIGLALCKKVVDTHNGIIYAEGKPKEGATFTCILPYQQR